VAGTGSDVLVLLDFFAVAGVALFRVFARAFAGAFRVFVAMDSSFPMRRARLSTDLREVFFRQVMGRGHARDQTSPAEVQNAVQPFRARLTSMGSQPYQ
jgi:hypothetical protein